MKVLITGFDPFGGESINPALEAVKMIPENIEGAQVIKLEIPTVFRKSLEKIEKKIEEINPDVVISIGVAINMDDARIEDNEGNQPIDISIYEDGESAYFSNLPIKAMVKEMVDNGIPASVSNTAGTFVCNHVMYGVLYLVNKKYKNIRAGFIHVPYIPAQVVNKPNTPSMSINDIAKGLELSIKAIVLNDNDIKTVGGAVC